MELIHTTAQLQFQNFLHYPDIRVEEGTFAFVTGRSGVGKSTYLCPLSARPWRPPCCPLSTPRWAWVSSLCRG